MNKPGMGPRVPLDRGALATPRAAAVAGIAFSVLFTTACVLMRLSVPEDFGGGPEWLAERAGSITLAVGLVPFAGIAFLWFSAALSYRICTFYLPPIWGCFSLDSLRRDGYL